MADPLDNPIYGYVPPIQTVKERYEHSTGEGSEEEEENVNIYANVIPNAVIANRYIDTQSPDGSTGSADHTHQADTLYTRISMTEDEVSGSSPV